MEVANRAKTRFLATASHDMRQPIHAMGLFVPALRRLARQERLSIQELGAIADRMQGALDTMGHLLNRLLDGEFDPGAFRHVAGYHRGRRRIEMYLESRHAQRVRCGGRTVQFRRGERILTEYSCKYTRHSFSRLARQAGLAITGHWQDDAGLFAVFALAGC